MKVIWSFTAEITFEAEKNYIEKKWSNTAVIEFIKLVDQSVNRLRQFPDIGKISDNSDRMLVISRQTTLIYRISDSNTIELLLFWNNKWNPSDLEMFL